MSETPPPGDAPFDPAFVALEPGFLVGNGRFTLVRLIGRGGMGVVWLARDESLREDVALKFLPNEIRFDAVALDDLRRETARSRKLTHPNIIRIHDLFKDEREAFISMEYVDGPNLSDLRLEQPERVFAWKYLEPLVKQLCEALDYAHSEKVIHRDLKPANMMLDSRGRLKLSDFGIAAQVSDSVSRVSMIRHGQSGTVTYMSPQQMDGKLPQVTDDIYALGATLYELLTSRPPFFTGDIAHQVRNLLPQPIAERLEELEIQNAVPPAVAALIMACLGKSPDQRPTSARAVAEWIGFQPVAPALPDRRVTIPEAKKQTSSESSQDSRLEIRREIVEPHPTSLPPAISVHEEPRTIPGPPSAMAEELPSSISALTHSTEEPEVVRSRAPLIAAAFAAVVVIGLGVGVFSWWLWNRATRREATASSPPVVSSSEFLRTEHVLAGHSAPVNSVTFSPDQKFLISGSADGTVRVYETDRGTLQWSAKADIGPITAVSVSRESKLLAAAGGTGLIRLYALPSGSVFQTLRMQSSPLTSAAFSPSGAYLASADEAGTVSLWNYEKGEAGPRWSAHNTPIRALAFSPDGRQLATGGSQDTLIRLWNMPDGAAVKTLKAHQGIVWSLAYSPDGSMLVSSSRDRSARIWSTANFSTKRTVQWRTDNNLMHGVAFSPNSKFLIAGSLRSVMVFKVETAARGSDRSMKATSMMRTVAFSPDGGALVAGGDNGLVHVWPFRGDAMFGGMPPPETPDDGGAAAPTDVPAANPTALVAPTPLGSEFTSLFNGRDLTDWSGDLSVWSVRDNVIRGSASRSSTSDPSCLFWRGGTLEDFELRLSFRLISGNAGIYFRASPVAGFGAGGYQFDLLPDRPGNLLETGADRPRRVLYRVPGSVPAIPLGGWHEATVIATGASIKHQLDGQTLCAIEDTFPNRPHSGLLALEVTGGPTVVEFKDIRLRRMANAPAASTKEWIRLFDGSSIEAWQGWNGADWRGSWEILNGELRTLRGANVSLATREEFDDFELEFEWKVAHGANSGVFYRATPGSSDLPKNAPEFQVVDDATPDGAKPLTAAGSIYGVVPTTNKQLAAVGLFNMSRIVARGSHVEHWLNGARVLEADLASPTVQRIGFQRYRPGWAQAAQGHIVLQNRVGEASYKNIRIRKLSDN